MTILTKPFSDKKEKLVVPLVENEQLPSAPQDVEGQGSQRHHRVIIFPARAHRVSASTTLCLLVTALTVVSIGIIGGKLLYDEYLSVSRRNTEWPYESRIKIPFEALDYNALQSDDSWSRATNQIEEDVKIDDVNKYEQIYVPDFQDGRSGRFIHDFNTNITGIIDSTGKRCFVMPLDRSRVLPPKSLLDLFQKMYSGYYKVDTEVVRETMRVVLPPMADTSPIGAYITRGCEGLPIYKLEKVDHMIAKRSANAEPSPKFTQFAGKGIMQFDIENMDELVAYEKGQLECQ